MKSKSAVALVTVTILMLFLPSCFAALEWDVLKTLKLEDKPLDVAFSTTRNHIYILNNKGEILVYHPNGLLLDKSSLEKGLIG